MRERLRPSRAYEWTLRQRWWFLKHGRCTATCGGALPRCELWARHGSLHEGRSRFGRAIPLARVVGFSAVTADGRAMPADGWIAGHLPTIEGVQMLDGGSCAVWVEEL